MDTNVLIIAAFVGCAALYSAVGHGGASAYLLVMTLFSFAPETIRPTALILNVFVSSIATVSYYRSGHFDRRIFLAATLASAPFAYLGSGFILPSEAYQVLLGLTLLVAAFRLALPERALAPSGRPVSLPLLTGTCAGIGLLSGLIGVGGGIFFTPLLVLTRWTTPKTAAAVSAPFIFVNSLSGLAGLGPAGFTPHPTLPVLGVCVIAGGFAGAAWGTRTATNQCFRVGLSFVLLAAAAKLIV